MNKHEFLILGLAELIYNLICMNKNLIAIHLYISFSILDGKVNLNLDLVSVDIVHESLTFTSTLLWKSIKRSHSSPRRNLTKMVASILPNSKNIYVLLFIYKVLKYLLISLWWLVSLMVLGFSFCGLLCIFVRPNILGNPRP